MSEKKKFDPPTPDAKAIKPVLIQEPKTKYVSLFEAIRGDLDLKIEAINQLKKLRTHKLPLKTDASSASAIIQEKFVEWVESNLKVLLGDAPSDPSVKAPVVLDNDVARSLVAEIKKITDVLSGSGRVIPLQPGPIQRVPLREEDPGDTPGLTYADLMKGAVDE